MDERCALVNGTLIREDSRVRVRARVEKRRVRACRRADCRVRPPRLFCRESKKRNTRKKMAAKGQFLREYKLVVVGGGGT